MTRKTPTKDAALLDALRSNLNLLGEIAMRYQVETQPERPSGDLPVPSAAPTNVRQAARDRRWPPSPRSSCGCCCSTPRTTSWASGSSTRATSHRPSSGPPRSSARRSSRPSPASSSATTTPAGDPDAQPRGRGPHPRAGPGGQAAGHRAARPRGHRRGAVRQPQGTGPHVLTAHAVRLSRRGITLPRINDTHRKETSHARNPHHRPRGPVHHHGGRLLGHRRRLRPRRGDRRPLVRLDGRLPDGPQGHLGLAAQAAAGRCPHHPGRGRHGAQQGATSGASFPTRR